ncbi:hypothetical protein [Moraxella lacunata]|uniref:hypothetical protein n=1 Tax=Moraxella lacunata TaxID=477 RepID=UPI003EE16968
MCLRRAGSLSQIRIFICLSLILWHVLGCPPAVGKSPMMVYSCKIIHYNKHLPKIIGIS